MVEEDIVREIEQSIVESEEIANRPSAVACLNCGESISVDPSTMVVEDDEAVEERIEPFAEIEPTELRIYCSPSCRSEDLESHLASEPQENT